MILCWITETRVREFEARFLTACQLAGQGFTSLVGRRESIKPWAMQCEHPVLWIDKSIGGLTEAEEERVLRRGGKAVSLDEEGGIYPEDKYQEMIASRFLEEYITPNQQYWTWGERQAESMLKLEGRFQDGQVRVTGNPRFDLCKQEMQEYHQSIDPELEQLGRYVLVNTNFALFNSNVFKEGRRPYILDADGNPVLDWDSVIKAARRSFDAFLSLIMKLSENFSELTIVVRPHPVEIPDRYVEAFSGYGRIILDDCTRPVSRSIACAKAVVHHDCTTAVEALIGGHYPISFLPFGVSERTQTLPVEISEVANSEDNVMDLVADRLNGVNGYKAERAKGLARCESIIANVEGTFLDRSSGFFAELGEPVGLSDQEVSRLSRSDRARIFEVSCKQKIRSLIAKNSKLQPKFPPLTQAEAAKLSDSVRKCAAGDRQFRCDWLSDTLVAVSPAA